MGRFPSRPALVARKNRRFLCRLEPDVLCMGSQHFNRKTDTTLLSHTQNKNKLQPCFAKTWQTASSMVSGLQSQLTLISGRRWCWLAEATQLVRTAGYLSWMRLPFPLAGSPGNEHDANCRVQQTMIMCAARSQQARAWAPNLRLALHSTKAPTERRDSSTGVRKVQVSVVSCDDRLVVFMDK